MPFCTEITANNASLQLFFMSLFELTLSIKIHDSALESGLLKGLRFKDLRLTNNFSEKFFEVNNSKLFAVPAGGHT